MNEELFSFSLLNIKIDLASFLSNVVQIGPLTDDKPTGIFFKASKCVTGLCDNKQITINKGYRL